MSADQRPDSLADRHPDRVGADSDPKVPDLQPAHQAEIALEVGGAVARAAICIGCALPDD
jgi:hypothetical protein